MWKPIETIQLSCTKGLNYRNQLIAGVYVESETKWTKELTVRSCGLNFPTFYSNWLLIELVFDVSANIVNINKYWRRNLSSSLSYHYFLDVALDSILLKSTTSFSVLDLNTKVIYLHLQHAAIHTHATHSTVLYLAGGYTRKSSIPLSVFRLTVNERTQSTPFIFLWRNKNLPDPNYGNKHESFSLPWNPVYLLCISNIVSLQRKHQDALQDESLCHAKHHVFRECPRINRFVNIFCWKTKCGVATRRLLTLLSWGGSSPTTIRGEVVDLISAWPRQQSYSNSSYYFKTHYEIILWTIEESRTELTTSSR